MTMSKKNAITPIHTDSSFNSFKCMEESSHLNESREQEEGKEEEDPIAEFTEWEHLDISSGLLRGIFSAGFEKPSPVQGKAIIPILNGQDVSVQAQSGTGKTGAFSIGALSKVNIEDPNVQALILSPTRELALQTLKVVETLGSMIKGLVAYSLIGGIPVEQDVQFIRSRRPQLLVGTPGRVFDILSRNVISNKKIKIVVLDEVDELLSFGFKTQIHDIFQHFDSNIQVALFSATIPVGLNTITDKFLRNPVTISVKSEMLTLEGIKQYFVAVDDDAMKYGVLQELYSRLSLLQCIIYCNSIKRVDDLYTAMNADNFPVCCIHGQMDKETRAAGFASFLNGESRVLISSDITSRGIDIQQVSTVINFDVPQCIHKYLHRIGRGGRFGKKGVAINFITRRDLAKIKEIEQHYGTQICELPEIIDGLF